MVGARKAQPQVPAVHEVHEPPCCVQQGPVSDLSTSLPFFFHFHISVAHEALLGPLPQGPQWLRGQETLLRGSLIWQPKVGSSQWLCPHGQHTSLQMRASWLVCPLACPHNLRRLTVPSSVFAATLPSLNSCQILPYPSMPPPASLWITCVCTLSLFTFLSSILMFYCYLRIHVLTPSCSPQRCSTPQSCSPLLPLAMPPSSHRTSCSPFVPC